MKDNQYFEELLERKNEFLLRGYHQFVSPVVPEGHLSPGELRELISDSHSPFKVGSEVHDSLLERMGFCDKFGELLMKIGSELVDASRIKGDRYQIIRSVSSQHPNESGRFHYDSHLFTLVLPIIIPDSSEPAHNGALHLFPYHRKEPLNEASNVAGKFYTKFWGVDLKSSRWVTFDFRDMRPLLFLGRVGLHYNSPVSVANARRVTFLSHYFDVSPRFGIGGLLRAVRTVSRK